MSLFASSACFFWSLTQLKTNLIGFPVILIDRFRPVRVSHRCAVTLLPTLMPYLDNNSRDWRFRNNVFLDVCTVLNKDKRCNLENSRISARLWEQIELKLISKFFFLVASFEKYLLFTACISLVNEFYRSRVDPIGLKSKSCTALTSKNASETFPRGRLPVRNRSRKMEDQAEPTSEFCNCRCHEPNSGMKHVCNISILGHEFPVNGQNLFHLFSNSLRN